jgi:hypothetical protein
LLKYQEGFKIASCGYNVMVDLINTAKFIPKKYSSVLSKTVLIGYVENYSCQKNCATYICTDLVSGLITGIKREVSQNLMLSP